MRSVRVSSLGPGRSEVTAVSPSKAPLLWAGLGPPVRDVCFHGSHLCPQNRERLRAGSRPNSLRPYCPKLLAGSHLAAPHPPGACELEGGHGPAKSAGGGGDARLAHRHTSLLCPDATDAGGRRAGPSQGHPRARSRRLPTEACHRCPGPGALKPPHPRGCPTPAPGSAVKVLVRCWVRWRPCPHCRLDTRPPALPSQGPDTQRHVGFLKALS